MKLENIVELLFFSSSFFLYFVIISLDIISFLILIVVIFKEIAFFLTKFILRCNIRILIFIFFDKIIFDKIRLVDTLIIFVKKNENFEKNKIKDFFCVTFFPQFKHLVVFIYTAIIMLFNVLVGYFFKVKFVFLILTIFNIFSILYLIYCLSFYQVELKKVQINLRNSEYKAIFYFKNNKYEEIKFENLNFNYEIILTFSFLLIETILIAFLQKV